MTQYKKTTGFTLVELMMSMSFIGALLMAIAVTSIHIMNTYTKGLTVREVNQVGRTVSEDLQRTIATATPFVVSPARTAPTDPVESKYVTLPGGGRLCVGAYTYAWNYGDTNEISGETLVPVYNTYIDNNEDLIRFVKVNDPGGVLCADLNRQIDKNQAKDLLVAGDRNLAVHELKVSSYTQNSASGQALYAISLIIGTNDQAQLNSADAGCLPPTEGNGSEKFCAINQFNIIARAGNRSGSL